MRPFLLSFPLCSDLPKDDCQVLLLPLPSPTIRGRGILPEEGRQDKPHPGSPGVSLGKVPSLDLSVFHLKKLRCDFNETGF
jgi:hypothetical protein